MERMSLRAVPPADLSKDRLKRRSPRLIVAILLLTVSLLTACSKDSDPGPDKPPATADQTAQLLAQGLSNGHLEGIRFDGLEIQQVNDQLETITAGMGDVRPAVTTSAAAVQGDHASVTLEHSWAIPAVKDPWTFQSTATMTLKDNLWQVNWSPGIVYPEVTTGTRLIRSQTQGERGEILAGDTTPIVSKRPVVRIGLDKTLVAPAKQQSSAIALAKLLEIDQETFAQRVKAAGPQAFVEAIVYREDATNRPRKAELKAIPGARSIASMSMLAPTREFARQLLGNVGDASKELIDESKGAIVAGDQVGQSGLQRRYDEQLRGTSGVKVQIVAAKATANPARPAQTPSPSPSAEPEPKTIFETKPTDGTSLQTTLDIDLQTAAEQIVAGVKSASAVVAIKPSSGAVLAAASGQGSEGQSIATIGQYPPGSTFKIISALALIRSGLTPDSTVDCPRTVRVDGREFENYDDYPASGIGKINLRTAIAQSCNTAIINERDRVNPEQLAEAAASLGLGMDYDVGFPAYFGSVPTDESKTGHAAALIGQGKVQASPLVMATVAASVQEGRTVLPHLIEKQIAKSTAQPLTAKEAEDLRGLMKAVVDQGSGRFLNDLGGPEIGAKTGTAEYGPNTPPETHAWMIAFQGDLAIAVFVGEGQSGSTTAGPLLEKLLKAAR